MTTKSIFPNSLTLKSLNAMGNGCMIAHLGIEFVEIGVNFLRATMPVDNRTKQPMGLLHGGASVALAETMGSIGAAMYLDLKKQYAVGLEINTNHIRSAKNGLVSGMAKPIHIGKSTHVWSIEIHNDDQKLIALSRITMAILDKK